MALAGYQSLSSNALPHTRHKITEIRLMESIIMFQQNPYNFERMFVIYRFRLLSARCYEKWEYLRCRSMLGRTTFICENTRKCCLLVFFFLLLLLSFILPPPSSVRFGLVVPASKSNLKAKNVSSFVVSIWVWIDASGTHAIDGMGKCTNEPFA